MYKSDILLDKMGILWYNKRKNPTKLVGKSINNMEVKKMFVQRSDFEKAHMMYDACMARPVHPSTVAPALMERDYDEWCKIRNMKYDFEISSYTRHIIERAYHISPADSAYILAISFDMATFCGTDWTDDFYAFDYMCELFDVFYADNYEMFSFMIDYLCKIKFPVHIDYCNYMLKICDIFNLTDYRALIMNYMHICGIGQSDLVL